MVPSDLDEVIRERLFGALDTAAVPVGADEAMVLAESHGAGLGTSPQVGVVHLPGPGRGRGRRRRIAIASTSLGLVAALVAVLVLVHVRGSSPPPSTPIATLNSSVLVTVQPRQRSWPPGVQKLDEVDAATGAHLASPSLPADFGGAGALLTTTGRYVVGIDLSLTSNGPTSGRTEAFEVGSTRVTELGRASSLIPGLDAGTVWLVKQLTPASSGLCTIRLVSVSGAEIVKPVAMRCDESPLEAVDGGLLVQEGSFLPLQIWNPVTDTYITVPASDNSSQVAAGGSSIVFEGLPPFCSSCGFNVANSVDGRTVHLTIRPPEGMSFDDQTVAVSPDGQLVAVLALPMAIASQLSHIRSGPGSIRANETYGTPVNGELVIFRAGDGAIDLERSVHFVEPAKVVWSDDGRYVFATFGGNKVGAIPAWSPTALVRAVTYPNLTYVLDGYGIYPGRLYNVARMGAA